MVERVLVLLLIAAVVIAGWGVLRVWQGWRVRRLAAVAPLAAIVPTGRPAVVAFTTPTCTECRTRQKPALARLADLVGDSGVVQTVSALDHPNVVAELGILTVPATVVLDSAGRVQGINLGFADEGRLLAQLQRLPGRRSDAAI